jgi:hypothetical protein
MRKQIVKVTLQVLLFLGIASAFVSSVTTLKAGLPCELENGTCVMTGCEQCDSSCHHCIP